MAQNTYLILHNIRSAENVGAIFRTADAAGVSEIYLTGYTPRPTDQFGRASGKIAKTALGAEQTVAWQYEKNISKVITDLKFRGVQVVAVEQDRRAKNFKKFKPSKDAVFIFGNEVSGLSKAVLDKSDQIIEIPMQGQKESLNVSVSVGVILFSLVV